MIMKRDINPIQAQMNLAVVSLVALVAIIGLVTLVLNAPVLKQEVSPAIEQAAPIDGQIYYQLDDGTVINAEDATENMLGHVELFIVVARDNSQNIVGDVKKIPKTRSLPGK